MIEINATPVRTSKNYDINTFSVPDGTFDGVPDSHFYLPFTPWNNGMYGISDKKDTSCRKHLCPEAEKQLENPSLVMNMTVDKQLDDPICHYFDFSGDDDTVVSDIVIRVKKDIRARIVLKFLSEDDRRFNNGLIKVHLEEGAEADVVVIYDLGAESSNFVSYENVLESGARLNYKIVDFAGRYSVHGYNSYLEGEGAESLLKTMYVGGKDSKIDLNFCQTLTGEKGHTDMDVVGALTDNAAKNFKGTINFVKGCKKSVGYENELCLLLGKEARSKQLPVMLCTEEEVEGSHSTAVGRIGGPELFYIMSRGLTRTEALKLLTRAKFNVILSDLFDEKLKEEIMDELDEKLYDEEG
ncbi:MAG: SufD family Fe-S cluster assembly protein [Clostridia bacterium]|nr:SufD family Fe-S cluster assembly protein [Clostridia bacterium]